MFNAGLLGLLGSLQVFRRLRPSRISLHRTNCVE
jgi:hypothetical protein